MNPIDKSRLELRLLGIPEMTWRGKTYKLARRQARALLYYLSDAAAPVARDQLLYLFWPDESEAKARRNLTRLVSYLRQELPHPEILLVTHAALQVNPERVQVDTKRFINLCANEATHAQAVTLYQGPFLWGFSLASSPEFDLWLTEAQGRYEARFLKTLANLVYAKRSQGAYAAAIEYAQLHLAVDDLVEEIHRHLISLYAAQGNRTAALRQYETCVQVLERELGVSPLPETYAVYESVLQGEAAPSHDTELKPSWTVLPSLDLPLVGRETDWEALASAYQKFHNGGIILISGEAGMGKTRLMQAFATQGNWTVLSGNNHPSTQTLPFNPLVQALRQALRQTGLWTGISPIWLGELTQLLPELRGHFPDIPQPLAVDPEQSRSRLFEALIRVFEGLAAQSSPMLLCLDDLHWGDEASLSWLSAVSLRIANSQVCIVGTYRQEERESLRELQRSFQREGLLSEVVLRGLSPKAIREILELISGEGKSHPELAARLHKTTGGNTFFLLELVRALLESGGLDSPPDVLPLPKTVQETILNRLARLTPLARQFLDAAAVLSPDLEMELLGQTAGRTELEAAEGLDELARQQLLKEQDGVFIFHHELLRTVAYQTLNPWRRKLLHRRAGDALHGVYGRNLAAVGPQMAKHYDAAGAYQQAVESYELAASAAQAVYAHEQAVQHLKRAIALASESVNDSKINVGLYESLGDSLDFIGRYAEAFEAYQISLDMDADAGSIQRANLLRKQAATLVPQQKYAEAVRIFQRTIADLQACQDVVSKTWLEIWFNTHLNLLNALYFQAHPEEMAEVARNIEGMLYQFGTPSQRFTFLANLDRIQMRQNRYRPTEEILDHRRAILDHQLKTGNPIRIASAHFGYAFVLLWHGDLSKAHDHFTEGVSLAKKHAYGLLQVQCLTYLIILYRLQGQIVLVKDLWPTAHEVAMQVGFPTYIGSSFANRAWLNYRGRQWRAAKGDASAALENWGNTPYPFQWLAHWVLLAVALHDNELGAAMDACNGMLDPVQQYLSDDVMHALEQATNLWRAQDAIAARIALQDAVQLAQTQGYI